MDGSTFDMEQYEKTYKTAMCRAFVHKGFCRYGDRCSFAHDEKELRSPQHYKTRPCQFFFRDGYCPYGTRSATFVCWRQKFHTFFSPQD